MAVVEEAIRSHLAGFAGLTALTSTRIYPKRLPQDATFPAATYQKITGASEYQHGGLVGFADATIQIDSWASTYAATKAVAEQVRLAMNTFTGTIAGVAIEDSRRVGEVDLIDPERDTHHVAQDYLISHAEATS